MSGNKLTKFESVEKCVEFFDSHDIGLHALFARVCFVLPLCLVSVTCFAENSWPQFRGPNASGIAERQTPPVQFGPRTNEVYRVEIPSGASSPCIWENRIFLTGFEGGHLETLCLDRRDGKLLWKKSASADKIEAFHPTEGSPAASTPATDGERVYVYFGSCGLLAYDFEGQELWRVAMPPAQHVGDFGTGASPIVSHGLVVLNRDMLFGSHLLALDARTGKTVWRQERTEFFSSFSTPLIWGHDGTEEIVVAGSLRLQAYDLKTGAEKWLAGRLPVAVCTTPVLGDGLLFFAGWSPGPKEVPLPSFPDLVEKLDKNKDGAIQQDEAASHPMLASLFTFLDVNRDGMLTREEWEARQKTLGQGENSLIAIRPGKGVLTESNVVWKQTRGLPYVPSPLYYQGLVYLVKDGGMVSCYNAKTGQPHYEQERLGAVASYYASPVAANGRIYIASLDGKVTVLLAGEKAEVIARNELGERCAATPAIVDHTLYYRTAKHLWAFAENKPIQHQ